MQAEGRLQHQLQRQVEPFDGPALGAQQVHQTDNANRHKEIGRARFVPVIARRHFLLGRVQVENIHRSG
ncbi:MAG: hypothetical protein DCC55_17500 [Chloroflexi bacterium]|nr:MAG: hypothetical protein DCC55_17500 [Chloroflexota bacterium]